MINFSNSNDAWENLKLSPPDDRGGNTAGAKRDVMLEKIMNAAIGRGASDIHINVGKKPVIRIDSALKTLDTEVVTAESARSFFKQCTAGADEQQTNFETNGSCDFAFSYNPESGKGARFRVNACKSQGNVKITLRRLPSVLLTTEEIGLTPAVLNCLNYDRGLFLVTGPTGSGKTTTLASIMVQILNANDKNHIYCIEDPTEYVLPQGKGLLTQREVGKDTKSFEQGLHDALRSNPNIIVVGEMRKAETIETALTAAETGHLVFATLHTTSAATTVERIVDTFPGNEKESVKAMLSNSIRGIICQQLLPKIGGGMVAAYEFLAMTPAIANLIREGKFHSIGSELQTGSKFGMRTLDSHLVSLCVREKVEPKEAYFKANNKLEFLRDLVKVPSMKDEALSLAAEYHKGINLL